jgi:dUTP pyrophosphatase
MKIIMQRLPSSIGMDIPSYATEGSSGMDLMAAIEEKIVLEPLARIVIPSGIRVAHIPEYFEVQIRSRSGLAANHGIIVLNSPATIDSDYRGELKILMMNLSNKEFIITRGMKIAQMVVSRYEKINLIVTSDVSKTTTTERGEKGFGSTGLY